MAVRSPVHFYFDYLSPYAFFAALELPELCEQAGAPLVYHPVVFGKLLDHWGHRGPAEIPPKAVHTLKDCVRRAARADVPFRAPRFHPFNPLPALRLSLAEVAGVDQSAVVRTLFQAGWQGGIDLGDEGELVAALASVGLDGAAMLARTSESKVKDGLRHSTESAIEWGVFGVPTMIVETELFWGVDQLEHLALHLAGRDPLREIPLESIASEGRAVVRPAVRDAG